MTSSERGRVARATAAVTAVYTAFLLCAQFGFLAQLEARLGRDARFLHLVLGAMLVGGVGGSVLAARRLRCGRPAHSVRLGLAATALATAVSPLASGAPALATSAVALGGALGFATVALAGAMPRLAPRARWGTVAGAGTGLAYAISNLPPLFAGPSEVRALLPALLAAAAALWPPREGEDDEPAAAPEPPLRFAALVAAFAALVAVDSAAFAHLQRSDELLAATWGSGALQLRQGAIHLAAALAAGALLDRRRLRTTVVLAGAIFACALPSLGDAARRPLAGALYPAGISLYSAALVAAPALAGGAVAAPTRAAWLYALAGWLGSALGVGAAEDGALGGVAVLGIALVALGALAELGNRRALRRALGPALAGGAVAGALLVGFARGADARDVLARGRAVYVAEGCQHCHSQYVRPVPHDELWWGPRRPLDRTERPPTPGNRRLGPDLANAGLRRSAWWHEAHLRDPRAVSPGSRMPSYAHLFEDGREDGRGAALVAYLGSLGAGHAAERAAAIARWRPPELPGDAARGVPLFARLCAPCHGPRGQGDGAAARAIARPTLDLSKPRFYRVTPATGESLDLALARAVRFGLPPGSMPGHEWLSEAEVADLVAFVRALPARDARSAGG